MGDLSLKTDMPLEVMIPFYSTLCTKNPAMSADFNYTVEETRNYFNPWPEWICSTRRMGEEIIVIGRDGDIRFNKHIRFHSFFCNFSNDGNDSTPIFFHNQQFLTGYKQNTDFLGHITSGENHHDPLWRFDSRMGVLKTDNSPLFPQLTRRTSFRNPHAQLCYASIVNHFNEKILPHIKVPGLLENPVSHRIATIAAIRSLPNLYETEEYTIEELVAGKRIPTRVKPEIAASYRPWGCSTCNCQNESFYTHCFGCRTERKVSEIKKPDANSNPWAHLGAGAGAGAGSGAGVTEYSKNSTPGPGPSNTPIDATEQPVQAMDQSKENRKRKEPSSERDKKDEAPTKKARI